jgi:hypothetical protein
MKKGRKAYGARRTEKRAHRLVLGRNTMRNRWGIELNEREPLFRQSMKGNIGPKVGPGQSRKVKARSVGRQETLQLGGEIIHGKGFLNEAAASAVDDFPCLPINTVTA